MNLLMQKRFYPLLITLFPFFSIAQTATMSASGNWATAANWGGNVGNSLTETVTINTGVNPTIFSGSNFTVGATTFNGNNTLNINSGGILDVGATGVGNSRNMTTNMNMSITVGGTLTIWGDLIANSNISLNILTGGIVT